MFESKVLDWFTRVHPAIPVVIYLPVIAVLSYVGVDRVGPLFAAALALGGYGAWTLTEY